MNLVGNLVGRGRRSGRLGADVDGPLDPDLPLHLLVVMALCTEAERLVPDGAPARTPPEAGTPGTPGTTGTTGTRPDGAPPP